MPQISVIVPVYNVEKYLHACLDSILAQTFTDFELILVDDGSKDSSGKICDEYAKKDSRIRVLHKKNGGAADARNCGIDHAMGEWIMFFDSDDCFESHIVQKLYETAQAENADMAVCSIDLFNDDCFEEKYIPDYFATTPGIFSGTEILSTGHIPTIYVTPCCKIFKKSLFDDVRFCVGRIYEDEIIIHRLLYKCDRIVVIEDILYHYRQVSGSVSHTIKANRLDWIYALYDRYFFYIQHGLQEYSNHVLKAYFWHLDEFFFKVEKTEESKARLKECLKNTRKLLPHYFKEKDISVKEKIMRTVFCISPSLYKRISKISVDR